MSTICKLNPIVREQRRRRRAVIGELRRIADRTGRLYVLAAALDKFRELSHLTGYQKDRAFQATLKQAKARGILLSGS